MSKMTDGDDIKQRIPEEARASLSALDWFAELESTNTWLRQQTAPQRGRFRAVIAEHQTAGRGRNEKIWLSPPSSGICLSVAYTFSGIPRDLPALTLAVGVGLAELLQQIGARGVALKWPNDLIVAGGKLGGILTEMQSGGAGGRTVVVGVGINVDLPHSMRNPMSAPWASGIADLASCMDRVPDRTELTAAIVTSLMDSIRRFESEGLNAFRSSWQAHDWLRGRTITVQQADGDITGDADGIDEDGALLVRTATGIERVISGSVRVATGAEVRG
jgi:BirA family biotin operon repressor/biotin-[acetyl-CoA-carboxylase] ligase